jgi:hypothetical protein
VTIAARAIAVGSVISTDVALVIFALGCVYFHTKKHCAEKRFPVTSNLRYMHGVLNVDEIKN